MFCFAMAGYVCTSGCHLPKLCVEGRGKWWLQPQPLVAEIVSWRYQCPSDFLLH